MFQVLFLFRLFIDLGHSKLFTFIFVFFLKKIGWKYFCKHFCKKSWKEIILGTSDAWLTSHSSHRPGDRAWIYLRLTNFIFLSAMHICNGRQKETFTILLRRLLEMRSNTVVCTAGFTLLLPIFTCLCTYSVSYQIKGQGHPH